MDCLKGSRKGLSAGMAGLRYEHIKLCLEDEPVLDNLIYLATKFVEARIPEDVRQAVALSKMTVSQKPIGKVRGIYAGGSFRCLVS